MSRGREKPVCNHDCFNCQFDDCICDEMTAADYAESRKLQDFVQPKTMKEKSIAAKKKAYYEENRESIAAYQKAYYEENRESIAAYQKAYREENRESIAAKKKAYYEENRESIAAYQKAYYEENRESIAAKKKGDKLRAYRKAHGYTQAFFAKMFGLSQPMISLYETGCVPFNELVFPCIDFS